MSMSLSNDNHMNMSSMNRMKELGFQDHSLNDVDVDVDVDMEVDVDVDLAAEEERNRELAKLYILCASSPTDWDQVNAWFQTHPEQYLIDAVNLPGNNDKKTLLHLICENDAPFEIVRTFLEVLVRNNHHYQNQQNYHQNQKTASLSNLNNARNHHSSGNHHNHNDNEEEEMAKLDPLELDDVMEGISTRPMVSSNKGPTAVTATATAATARSSILSHSSTVHSGGSSTFTLPADIKDRFGRVPLHYAAANVTDERIFHLLMETFPTWSIEHDDHGLVPLHYGLRERGFAISTICVDLLCRNDAARLKDKMGMLPLHYACAYGVSVDVLRFLTKAYSDAMDNLSQSYAPYSFDHPHQPHAHAHAHAHHHHHQEELSDILERAVDERGMAPLHYICGNPSRKSADLCAAFLLEVCPAAVNTYDKNQNLPLQLLAMNIKNLAEQRSEAELRPFHDKFAKILDLYLEAKPEPSIEFLTSLQALPDWLRERAVVNTNVQVILNVKISRRFPTAIFIADFIINLVLIFSFSMVVKCTIHQEMNVADDWCDSSTIIGGSDATTTMVQFFFFASMYFVLRTLISIISFITIHHLKTWLMDPTNWIGVITNIMSVGFASYFLSANQSTTNMNGINGQGNLQSNQQQPHIQLDNIRWLCSIAILFFWLSFLYFLRSGFISFAVFVNGLINVLRGLSHFVVALLIILSGFTSVFYLIYNDSANCNYCRQIQNHDYCVHNFCTFPSSFVKVYAMLLGETDEAVFRRGYNSIYRHDNGSFWDVTDKALNDPGWEREQLDYNDTSDLRDILGTVFFLFFIVLVIILLLNVLIAIVTDTYAVIKDERAEIIFWGNRLDTVIETNVMKNSLVKILRFFQCRRRWRRRQQPSSDDHNHSQSHSHSMVSSPPSGQYHGNHGHGQYSSSSFSPHHSSFAPSSVRGTGGGPPHDHEREVPLHKSSGHHTHHTHHAHHTPHDQYHTNETFVEGIWTNLFSQSEDDWNDISLKSHLEIVIFVAFRIFAFFFFLVWIPLGFCTLGSLWPRQVREKLFVERTNQSRTNASSSALSGGVGTQARELEKRSIEVRILREDIQDLHSKITQKLTTDKTELASVKSQFLDMMRTMRHEMNQVDKIVRALFDKQTGMD